MIERIKTILLLVLVANSLILSSLLIFYSPYSTNVSLSEYIPRIVFGNNTSFSEVLEPKQIVYHFGNNSHSIVKPSKYPFHSVIDEMREWTFYDFSSVDNVSWQDMLENKEGIEVYFSSPLQNSILSSLFKTLATSTNINNINRLWITTTDQGNVKAYFISDKDDRVFEALTSVSKQKLSNFVSYAKWQPKYSYHVSYTKDNDSKRVEQFYYLPVEDISMKIIKKSYTTVSVGDFIQLLFIDSSVVRKVEVDYKTHTLYTDGNRSMQFSQTDKYISYFQPVSDSKKELNLEKDVYAAVSFVNSHGGWDGTYQLEDINILKNGNQSFLIFKQYIDGYPVIKQNGKFGIIQLQVTNGIVSSFQRSMILLDKYIDIQLANILTDEQIFGKLKVLGINERNIKAIELGYYLKQSQGNIHLEPYYEITTINNEKILTPAYESVVPNNGLEQN